MGLMSPQLSLDLRPSLCIPESINGFLREVSVIGAEHERSQKVDEFVKKLEDEMKKIEVFQRELPLCMHLLKDAILALKQESSLINGDKPVLEEFIPLKKETTSGEKNHQISSKNDNNTDGEDSNRDNKKNWMSSVQLWSADNVPTTTSRNHNQTLVPESQKGDDKRNSLLCDDLYDPKKHKEGGSKGFMSMINRNPGFSEFKREVEKQEMKEAGLSLVIPGIKQQKQDSNGLNSKLVNARVCSSTSDGPTIVSGHHQPNSRKQRRCWSPELHRRFVDALNQLGGPQVATPKQIRELMRVEGLTNDEVKSHLQKYRLHARRVPNNSSTSTHENNNNGLTNSWTTQDNNSESSKPTSSQSGSPQGPLQFPGHTGGTSTTGGDSMEEDEDDEKSESYSWKGHVHRPKKNNDV